MIGKSLGLKLEYSYAWAYKKIRSYSLVKLSASFSSAVESYANDRMLRRVYLHFYAPYGYASISFTVWYTRIDSDVLDPLHTCAYTGVQVRTGNLLRQFLRNFPPRLPKLTLTVNHSLRKVYASPNRFPIYDAKTGRRRGYFYLYDASETFARWP